MDLDGDGWTEADGDCDDGDDTINPGEAEVVCDEIDNDCDGLGEGQAAGEVDGLEYETLDLAVNALVDGSTLTSTAKRNTGSPTTILSRFPRSWY